MTITAKVMAMKFDESDNDEKRRVALTKRTIFRKCSNAGGGVIFNPEFYIADFKPLSRVFEHEIIKKMEDFPKTWGVKGRLELFQKFIRFGVAKLQIMMMMMMMKKLRIQKQTEH